MSMELGNDMLHEPVLRGLRLFVHSNVNDRELLIDHILATQGQLEENPSSAAFCLAASYPHDAEQAVDILSESSGNSVILDESWIWKCLYLKQIVPWYPYVLKSTTSRVAMNSITNITLDTETRDLQELCICLARHLPFVRQGSKAYDEIFIYLSEKFPHRSEKKFRELYEIYNELINSCVERLEKQFDAILPPSEQLHPSDFLALRNESSSLKHRTLIPRSLPSNPNGSSGLMHGRALPYTSPNGVHGRRERDSQDAQQLSTGMNHQSNRPLVPDNNPAPMPDLDDSTRSVQHPGIIRDIDMVTVPSRAIERPERVIRTNGNDANDSNMNGTHGLNSSQNLNDHAPITKPPSTLPMPRGFPAISNPSAQTGLVGADNSPAFRMVPTAAMNPHMGHVAPLARRPVKRKPQHSDPDYYDSGTEDDDDTGDYTENMHRTSPSRRENKQARIDQGRIRGPRFTEEEVVYMKQWIVDNPYDIERFDRMSYWTDFAKRSPIGPQREASSWSSAYIRLILPYEEVPSLPARPRGKRKTLGGSSVLNEETIVTPNAGQAPSQPPSPVNTSNNANTIVGANTEARPPVGSVTTTTEKATNSEPPKEAPVIVQNGVIASNSAAGAPVNGTSASK